MSKMLQISLALLLVGSLAACGTNKNEDKTETDTGMNDQTVESPTETDGTHNAEHKLELADDVATKISELDEVENANVIVTDNNAYVAVDLKNNVDEDEKLNNKIADQARAAGKNFDNVYVSTDPDFTKQFTEYGEKIKANEPVEGFFEEFSDTVKRVFPDAK